MLSIIYTIIVLPIAIMLLIAEQNYYLILSYLITEVIVYTVELNANSNRFKFIVVIITIITIIVNTLYTLYRYSTLKDMPLG